LDVLLTIVFSVCAVLAVAGALAAAVLPAGPPRLVGLLGVAVGTAGVLATLSAGFVALVALVSLGASALLLGAGAADAGTATRPWQELTGRLGAVAAVLLLAVLVFVAVRGSFAVGAYPGGSFGAGTLGRLLFGRDALAVEAVGVALALALAFGGLTWSRRG
jgi:hypothetical protein